MPRPGGHAGPIVTALALVGGSPCLGSHRGDCLRGGLRGASLPPTGWSPARQEVFLVFPMVSLHVVLRSPRSESCLLLRERSVGLDPKRRGVRQAQTEKQQERNVYAGKGPPQQRTHCESPTYPPGAAPGACRESERARFDKKDHGSDLGSHHDSRRHTTNTVSPDRSRSITTDRLP